MVPEPFCDFRRLWYTPSYRFSVLRGWRHGVRSRSLGGICRHLELPACQHIGQLDNLATLRAPKKTRVTIRH
jgi:hypothetical protein